VKRAVALLAGAALVVAPAVLRPSSEHAGGGELPALARWLGPIGSLAAAAQWVRADVAFREQDDVVGFARAELALALDPGATGTWSLFAQRQILDRAAPSLEPSAELRRSWIRAGRATLRRGLATAREPEELWFLEGLLLVATAERDPDLGWPGGDRALCLEAARAFERAAEAGHPQGAEMAAAAHGLAHAAR